MGYILLFIGFIIICFIAGWNILGWFLIVVSVGFLFLMINVSKQNKIDQEKEIQRRIKLTEQKEIDKREYERKKMELTEKYGQIDKEIVLSENNIKNAILAFSKTSRIWLAGNDLPMSCVLSCSLSDNSKIIKGRATIQSKTNTGDMAKRGVVGGVLLGGAGALAGSVTAKRDGTILQEEDNIIHNYTVLVNIDSLSNPIVQLQCASNRLLADEIVGLLNVIINRNKGFH